ncbi:MAG: type II secretion system protein [Anaerohalosphaera sp.]|nr:type II secretion system protein [Anaerohalosphaera sp.]
MDQTNKRFNGGGFTMVEMLVTLVIIGIVLAVMLPAFNAVKNSATNLRQKGQFNQIEIGLEGYRNDFGDYPNDYYPSVTQTPDVYSDTYSGAQILAEAMVGSDGLGVHRSTQYRLDGGIDYLLPLDGVSDGQLYQSPVDRTQRRGPYIDLEAANAITVGNLYNSGQVTADDEDTFVLADMFGTAKNKATGKAAGLPILYYKANTLNAVHTPPADSSDGYGNNIYTVYVNSKVLDWGVPGSSATHELTKAQTTWNLFYDATSNPNFTNPTPYRSESFILHSAGPDGIYGTADDVFNFEGSGN